MIKPSYIAWGLSALVAVVVLSTRKDEPKTEPGPGPGPGPGPITPPAPSARAQELLTKAATAPASVTDAELTEMVAIANDPATDSATSTALKTAASAIKLSRPG